MKLTQLIAFVGAICLAACSSGGNSTIPYATSQPLTEPDTTLQIRETEDLRIAPQDKLAVAVYGVPDLEGEYVVDQDGEIKMPLIGEIAAEGYTQNEFAAVLEFALEESYLQNADVTVSIEESIARQLTVDGAVENPGQYPVEGKMHLLQAVAVAGGPDERANPKRVVIFREINGQRMAAAFDLTAIRRGEAEDPLVYGNDIVVVDGSSLRAEYSNVIRTLSTLALFLAL
ncbi:MAG: polysaccharide biosynthesis/export family protein [Pseudomonadota bacterium]